MGQDRKAALVVALIVGAMAVIYAGKRYRINDVEGRTHPLTAIAEKINGSRQREWCDEQVGPRRLYAARVVDRYRGEIAGLWREREQGPEAPVSTLSLGKISLRVSEPPSPALTPAEYDESAWSWEEVYGMIQKTQSDFLEPAKLRSTWRDVDTMTAFLLEKDFSRTLLGRKFVRPDKTEHQFRPNGAVERTGPAEFTVSLDAGEFSGYEKVLEPVISSEWTAPARRVRIKWVKNSPVAYRFEANLRSGRTYVNHQRRAIVLENLAWTKTVAHEFGHVLGFDDHYYSVWNDRNCYYLQLARNGDLMSNSQRGKVLPRHWEILVQAYPYRAKAAGPFTYVFQPEERSSRGAAKAKARSR